MNKRFLISWMASTIVMYTLSYIWHGIVLNDLIRLSYPLDIFLILAGGVYFILGFILALGQTIIQRTKMKSVKGYYIGIPLGFFVYLIAFVFGISFNVSPKIEHILMDCTWQMMEQGIGGVIAYFLFSFMLFYEKANQEI